MSPADNISTDNTASLAYVVNTTDIAITASITNGTPASGVNTTATITATNTTGTNATGVAVNVTLPAGATNGTVTVSAGTYNAGTGVWTIGNLAANANATLSFTSNATVSGTYTASASLVTAGMNPADNNAGNNTASTSYVVNTTNVAVTGTITSTTPGYNTNTTETFTATNTTATTAANVSVNVTLPASATNGTVTVSAGTYNAGTGIWTIGTLAGGANATLSFTSKATVSGNYTASATLVTPGMSPADNISTDNTASLTYMVNTTNIAITETVSNATPSINVPVTFTVTATNTTGTSATGVSVNVTLPSGATFGSFTPSQGTYNATTNVWTIGTIAPGAAPTLTFTAQSATAGVYPVTSTLVTAGITPADNNAADNTATVNFEPKATNIAVTGTITSTVPLRIGREY